MSARKAVTWTFIAATDDERRPRIWCERCGDEERLNLPLTISQLVDLQRGFNRRHAGCVKQGEAV